MSQLGMGAMIGALSGNEDTVNAYTGAIGKPIASAVVDPDGGEGDGSLKLRFADGTGIELYDGGRSCCESRYVTCDDDLSRLAGATLASIELKPGPDTEDEWGGSHETAFVEVRAGTDTVTLTTHNDHNGYYGGFWFQVRPLPASGIETEGQDRADGLGAEHESPTLEEGAAQ